ncbi:MAG TPA: hypothetical protein VIY86_08270, partial [Pirellulaceae bacterium]
MSGVEESATDGPTPILGPRGDAGGVASSPGPAPSGRLPASEPNVLATIPLQLPAVSIVLLFFAGLLVGCAFAVGRRDEPDPGADELAALRFKNLELDELLRIQHDHQVALTRRLEEMSSPAVASEESSQPPRDDRENHSEQVNSALEAIRELRDHAVTELELERRRRSAAETDLQALAAERNDLTARVLRIQSERENQARNDAAGEALHSRLQALEDIGRQRSQAIQALLDQAGLGGDVESDPDPTVHDLVNLRKLHEKLLAQRAEVEHLQQRKREYEEAIVRWKNEHQQRVALEHLLRTNSAESSTARIAESELATLQDELRLLRDECERMTLERDAVGGALDEARRYVAELHHELDSHRRALETMERHRRQLQAEVVNAQVQPAAPGAWPTESDTALARLETMRGELENARGQIVILRSQLATALEESRIARREYDCAAQEALSHRGELEQIRIQLRTAERDVDRIRSDREETLVLLRAEQNRQSQGEPSVNQLHVGPRHPHLTDTTDGSHDVHDYVG